MYSCDEDCNVNYVLRVCTYATKNVKESCDYYATTKACPTPPGSCPCITENIALGAWSRANNWLSTVMHSHGSTVLLYFPKTSTVGQSSSVVSVYGS